MEKQLLITCINFDIKPEIINESITKNNGVLIVSGVLQRANVKNHNGRVYPKQVLLREVNKYKQLIKERRSLGELDHPETSVVSLTNTSHVITDIWWEGDDVCGSVEILPTPAGNILRRLFESNIKTGISSRALGTLKESNQGMLEVQDDLELIGWDFVSNPSTSGAFMEPTRLNESINSITSKTNTKNKTIDGIIRDILQNIK